MGIDKNNNPFLQLRYLLKAILITINTPLKILWKKLMFKPNPKTFFEFNSKYLIKLHKQKYPRLKKITYREPLINWNKASKETKIFLKNRKKNKIIMFGDNNYKGSYIFKKVAKYFPNENFCIYDSNVKKKYKKNNITYLPWRVFPLQYKDAKLVLIPSICGEAFSRTAKECQLLKLDFLASNNAGLKFSVKKKKNLVDNYKKVSEWERAIEKILLKQN